MIILGKKIGTDKIHYFNDVKDVIGYICGNQNLQVKTAVYGCLNKSYGCKSFHGWELHYIDVCNILNDNVNALRKYFENKSEK